jgi:hypothetical protein
MIMVESTILEDLNTGKAQKRQSRFKRAMQETIKSRNEENTFENGTFMMSTPLKNLKMRTYCDK